MRKVATFFGILLLVSLPVFAQDESQDKTDENSSASFHHEQWSDYRVGAGDTLEIQVVDVPELNQTVDVSGAGEISLQPVGNLKVSDMTAEELEDAIAAAFQQKGLLKNPEVLVYVRNYRAKRIYVTGELAFPGEFVISKGLTVLDGILLAGGVAPTADRYAYIQRRKTGPKFTSPPPASVVKNPAVASEDSEVFRVDLEPLKQGKPPVPDLALQAGDYVIVPRRTLQFFYVMGEVLRPLNYILPMAEPLHVSQAIAGAGGPTTTAKISDGLLIRTDEKGERHETKVDFKKILKGEEEDPLVQANDVIFIPGSKIRTIGEGYIRAANAMIGQAAFRIGRMYQLPRRPTTPTTAPDQLPSADQTQGFTQIPN
ncbi:MAG: polysaccharide biosynthesis/export family protein [Acidobacteriota bacterium]